LVLFVASPEPEKKEGELLVKLKVTPSDDIE